MLGQAGRDFQKIGDGAGQFVVPFSTTPSSVASQIVNYSPVGAFTEILKQANNGKFNQREFVEAVGRSLTGTGTMVLGAKLYDNDNLSLGFPASDQRKQELDRAENKKYNAIRLGDTWHDSVTFGPLGSLLTVGGYFQQELDNTGSISSAMTNALAGGYQSLLQHSFLEGLSSAVDAIKNPERNAKDYIARTVSSFVPSIFSDIAATTDDVQRDVRAQDIYGKMYENTIKRIPEARENLEPTVDTLGGKTEEGGVLGEMIAPTRPQESDATMVTKELRRLMEKDINVSPTKLGPSDGYKSLTDEQNTRLWKETGRIIRGKLSNLMQTPEYQQLSDEKKGEVIDDFVRKSKTIGRASIAVDATQDLQGQKLMKKLSELKKDNVLTGSVFEVYKRIRGGVSPKSSEVNN